MSRNEENEYDKDYTIWKQSGDPGHLKTVVDKLEPTINGTLKASNIQSPIVRDRAKMVAAQAIKSYDPSRGTQLHTHVANQLKRLVSEAPRIQEPFVPSERFRKESNDIRMAMNSFTDRMGRDPTDEELADITYIPLKKVIKIRTASRARVPLSAVEEANEDNDQGYDVVGGTRSKADDWAEAVYYGLGDLDKLIFMHRSGYRGADKLSNEQIAEKLHMSPQAVSVRARNIQNQLDSFNTR